MHLDKQKPPKIFQRQQNTRSSSGVSQQISLQQEKKRKFFIKQTVYFLYFISRFVITISILIVLHQNFISQILSTDEYSRMQENIGLWKQDAIINITTINSYNCPQGYETFTSYQWSGTKEGCYCYTSLGQWDYIKILQGACNEQAMSAGCRTVSKVDPIPFLFWRKDELICLKRIKNLDFFTNLEQVNIQSIPCSEGRQYQIEIPSKLNATYCPITDIHNNNNLKYQLPEINFSYSRETSYPIVGLKIAEYEFCPDFQKQNISPFKQRSNNYNLENQFKQFCQGTDPRVVVIDEIGEDQLFNNNPRIIDIVSSLPAYPQPMSDYRYKLGFIRYPDWKYSCRKSLLFKLTTTEIKFNLEQTISYTKLCIALGTAFIVIGGILLTIFLIFRKLHEFYYKFQQNVLYDTLAQLQKKKPNLYERVHKKFKSELLFFLGLVLSALSLIVVVSLFYQHLQISFDWYQQSRQCTSDTMKQWIENGYMGYFDKQQRNTLLCIILALSLITCDTIMFLWRNTKGDLKKDQLDDQEATNIFDDDFFKKTYPQISLAQQNFHDKELQLKKIQNKHQDRSKINGTIAKNIPQIIQNDINVTEQSLMPFESMQPMTMIRPKRLKKVKAFEPSEGSEGTQQWNI